MSDDNFFETAQFRYIVGDYSICGKEWGESNCRYAYHKLYFFIGGEGFVEVNGTRFVPKPGDFYLIPAGTVHSYGHNPEHPIVKYWCHFDLILSEGRRLEYHPEALICLPTEAETLKLFKILLGEDHLPEPLHRLNEQSTLAQLLMLFLRNADIENLLRSDSTGLLDKIDRYIDDNIEENIRSADLAAIASLHPNYFISFFRVNFGNTPIGYLNNRRLQHAIQKMKESPEEKIQNISRLSGFNDYRYFSRLFKRRYGLSPSTYRAL